MQHQHRRHEHHQQQRQTMVQQQQQQHTEESYFATKQSKPLCHIRQRSCPRINHNINLPSVRSFPIDPLRLFWLRRLWGFAAALVLILSAVSHSLTSTVLVAAWVVHTHSSNNKRSAVSPRRTTRSHSSFSSTMKSTPSMPAAAAFSSASSNDNNVVVLPRLPLPPPLCSNVPGTWAYDTMSRRVNDDILARTVADNAENWNNDNESNHMIRHRVDALRTELQNAATTPLTPLVKPSSLSSSQHQQDEWNEWQAILLPYLNHNDTWLTAPWMVSEFYVYRRLMDCLDYWNAESLVVVDDTTSTRVQNAGYRYDPFAKPKRNGLTSSVANAEAALRKMQQVRIFQKQSEGSVDESLEEEQEQKQMHQTGLTLATQLSLWGNQMDLSLWPAAEDATAADSRDVFSAVLESAATQLLHDDSALLVDHCWQLLQSNQRLNKETKGTNQQDTATTITSKTSKTCIDIIVDNAGFELVTDLALAQYLIESGIAGTVTFQLKSHPTFVSDAMEKDLLDTIDYYADKLDATLYPACAIAGAVWRSMIQSGQWQCVEQNFWTQGLAMWDMPHNVRSELVSRCDLAFVKGDANYRRLLGDRDWDYTAPFADVVGCYFPVPVCALRTLKAEIGCGMSADQVKRAQELDPNWMTNGRFGVVHFGQGAGH